MKYRSLIVVKRCNGPNRLEILLRDRLPVGKFSSSLFNLLILRYYSSYTNDIALSIRQESFAIASRDVLFITYIHAISVFVRQVEEVMFCPFAEQKREPVRELGEHI